VRKASRGLEERWEVLKEEGWLRLGYPLCCMELRRIKSLLNKHFQ
jgi:hypothetical protein